MAARFLNADAAAETRIVDFYDVMAGVVDAIDFPSKADRSILRVGNWGDGAAIIGGIESIDLDVMDRADLEITMKRSAHGDGMVAVVGAGKDELKLLT